jgi:phosphotransferase system  glucose/maltose/N-acetylglucosamine-specific IIC component
MRDYQQVVLVLLLISAGTLFLTGILEPAHFLVLTVPVSVFVTYYFISARKFKWFYETLLWVLAGVVVWNQLASIG